jgi:UDP-sugar transporter A1/2/3
MVNKPSNSGQQLSFPAIISMALLAIQFGIQPLVTKRYTSPAIIKSTVILLQEVVKLIIAVIGISLSSSGWSKVTAGWTISSWLRLSLLPATIYLVQNMCSLLAYQNLDAITYNVLNQTKTLSAAMCCYFLLGKRQSGMQMLALVLLLMAALVMEGLLPMDALSASYWIEPKEESPLDLSPRRFTHGVIPILIASFLSGLAGAITQKSLQVGNRNALLFTMELCVASILLLLISFFTSDDGKQIQQRGFFDEWTYLTIFPILTNAAGGILVGLVIKFAGTVQKGFALIFGILLSGILQGSLSREEIVGGILAGVSLWMHSTYPYVMAVEKAAVENGDNNAAISKKVVSNGERRGIKSRKED